MAASRPRVLTPRMLAEDEHRIDQVRGRRYCRVHRDQQMIPLLPGLDVCPACAPQAENGSRQPDPESNQSD